MKDSGTVFLVDDDAGLRRAMTRLLEANGFRVRSFESAEAFLGAFEPTLEGCLLVDLRMPGKSGLELQRALARSDSTLPVIFLTGHADVPTSVFAMKQGAVDFIEKPAEEQVLIAALERALELHVELRRQSLELNTLRQRYASLTPREQEVMAEVVAGHRNKQAAHTLGIAERTVKLHRANVLDKMRADSLAELVRMAERLGLGPDELA